MTYVDGFVLPIQKRNLGKYTKIAKKACEIWMDHGALDYKECVGDDLKIECVFPFSKLARLRKGEVVVFAFITYKSRAHRDAVNKKVFKDPRIHEMGCSGPMPFDMKRMSCAGFKTIVEP